MALPANIAVSFDFSSGATFGTGFVIGSDKNGIIGTSSFGSSDVILPVVDLTPNVYEITIKRGRNILRDTYEAGTAIVRVLDPDSNFNPQSVTSPYYPYLTPLRKVRISATTATTDKFLFSGYVTDYKYSYPTSQETGYVDIYCSDAFRLFQMANITAVTDSGAGQDTGTRINKILDQVSFPASMRTIATGVNTCVADPATSRTSLDAIKNAEFSETGAYYLDGTGTAVFKNRTQVMSSLAATPIEFNQTTGIPYQNLKYAFDDKLIINTCTFTRVGGSPITVFDQTSIDKYFPHGITQDNLVAQTDALVTDIAREFISTRKDTTIRIDEMTVDLLDTSVPTDTMIGLDFFDNLKITNVQPDGSTIVKTLQCQGINWSITPNKMTAVITTLEPIGDAFIIGSSTYGIIGVSTFSYQEQVMATFPVATGDVLTAATYNSLPVFTVGADNTADYTAVLSDQYQVLEIMNKATAIAFKIPTNATAAFPIGTVITVLNRGVGVCTISAVTSGTTTVLSAGAVAAAPTLAQYKAAACLKIATDTWIITGAIG